MPDNDKRKPTIAARETIKDANGKDCLFFCVELGNYRFVHRAMHPWVRLEDRLCLFALINDEGNSLKAYFPVKVPMKGKLYFGYVGEEAELVLPYDFEKRKPVLLDRKRIPKTVVEVTDKTFPMKK
jgi:hypothetical protein